MEKFVYRADVIWADSYDSSENEASCFVLASSWNEAVQEFVDFYGESNISSFSMCCLDANIIAVPRELGDKISAALTE